ncbi:MAG: PHP domain-containing protein [Deltaproteobacteria bacterium]|nr:PHP domain-containing protein [Deltaproteobacteria bacterium]MBW2052263.1 PHP domain-containing protein [Deltaproteobacteria bacterium]MBW2140829.1 PHP domain-containing protein [Deltaproteobacteria bacterium]
MNDPRGSLWRKWDLHLHTPASPDYKDKSISNEEIIRTLLENQISAVAITDHHAMDVKRIEELSNIADGRLTVFPGIEVSG